MATVRVAMAELEISQSGRWGGRLTRRLLPTSDPLIDALSLEDRSTLAGIWLGRAAMERRVGDAFEVVRNALLRLGAASELVDLAARAVDDEARHTELSRVVASRFAGRELGLPEQLWLEVPKHKGASRALRDTLHVVGQCVLNETTASVFLECCLRHARGSLVTSALKELLSDEIDHGRIGWAHLASLEPRVRNEVAPWLLPMAYLNLRTWREYTPQEAPTSEVLAAHGAPSAKLIDEALVGALTELIVPGLQELGMVTAPLEGWLEAGARTDVAPVEFLRPPQ